MKNLFILASLFLAGTGMAAPILDEDDQYQLLKSIDDICGDTWCEGDSNWSFDAIACDTETGCTLSVTMKPYDFDDGISLPERSLSCDLDAFTQRDALVEVTNRGLQYTPELFEAVGECIEDLTDRFGPMYVPLDTSCRSLFAEQNPKAQEIELKDDIDSLDAALWAVTRLVRNQAKIDESCKLETIPSFRDKATCRTTAETETCSFPTQEGWLRVRVTLENGHAEVRYYPKKPS